MKTRWLPIFIIVSSILVTAFTVSAYAQAATVYRYSGQGAAAYFSSVDELGCNYTNIFVQFVEVTAGNPPKPSEQPTLLYMYINQWNASGLMANASFDSFDEDGCVGGSSSHQRPQPLASLKGFPFLKNRCLSHAELRLRIQLPKSSQQTSASLSPICL